MKYVRTKDGIFDTDLFSVIIPYGKGSLSAKTHIAKNEITKLVIGNDIIKVADTIEELCDELVFEWHRSSISHDNDTWHLYHEISLKEEVENALDDGFRASKEEVKNIYGAIWTDRGLIYVARMNDKRELELL